MKISHITALLALVGTSAMAVASTNNFAGEGAIAPMSAESASRWHVEVRDTLARPGTQDIDPTSGRLAAAFDLTIGGKPGRLGNDIPYVDAASLEIDDTSGSIGTLTIHDGLTVSITGTPEKPSLRSEDVAIISFDQVMTKGTMVTQPKSAATSIEMPFRPSRSPMIVGGYAVGKPGSAHMRVFVIHPS